jgi:hypothetical protein
MERESERICRSSDYMIHRAYNSSKDIEKRLVPVLVAVQLSLGLVPTV